MKIEDVMRECLSSQEYDVWLYDYKCKTHREDGK